MMRLRLTKRKCFALSAQSTSITVDYAVSGTATGGGTDYTLADGTLTIPANTSSANITIASIVDDALVEGAESVIVTLSNPSGATLGLIRSIVTPSPIMMLLRFLWQA